MFLTEIKVPSMPIEVGRHPAILKLCADKRVLHVGCTDGDYLESRADSDRLFHRSLTETAKEVVGVDIDKIGLARLQTLGFNNVVYGNAEHLDEIEEIKGKQFDYLVAAEIVEHLNNPGLFFSSAAKIFTPNMRLIMSVPNGLKEGNRRWMNKGIEEINPDHNYWFSYATIDTLLRKNDYEIEDWRAYSYFNYKKSALRTSLAYLSRAKIKRSVTRYIKHLSIARKYSRNANYADGFIIVARPIQR